MHGSRVAYTVEHGTFDGENFRKLVGNENFMVKALVDCLPSTHMV